MAQGPIVKSGVHAYRQVAEQIIRQIDQGERRPGERLPTVRRLAEETGLSQGTAKHVYDVLEQEGYIIKEQGRGTFVRQAEASPTGAKARAMEAIDRMLDEMRALAFSWQETRIFLDLKLRQREQQEKAVRIGAVDCSPEALSMMREQIRSLPNVEVDGYLLDSVLESSRRFDPQADIVVTTTTHGEDLGQKLPDGRAPVCLVMSLRNETAIELASISPQAKVGVVCKSRRFAGLILKTCQQYCKLQSPVGVAYFGNPEGVRQIARESDLLILAPNYHLFASREEEACLVGSGVPHILYQYQVEKGSIVYLESQIKALLRADRQGH